MRETGFCFKRQASPGSSRRWTLRADVTTCCWHSSGSRGRSPTKPWSQWPGRAGAGHATKHTRAAFPWQFSGMALDLGHGLSVPTSPECHLRLYVCSRAHQENVQRRGRAARYPLPYSWEESGRAVVAATSRRPKLFGLQCPPKMAPLTTALCCGLAVLICACPRSLQVPLGIRSSAGRGPLHIFSSDCFRNAEQHLPPSEIPFKMILNYFIYLLTFGGIL